MWRLLLRGFCILFGTVSNEHLDCLLNNGHEYFLDCFEYYCLVGSICVEVLMKLILNFNPKMSQSHFASMLIKLTLLKFLELILKFDKIG